MGKGVAAEDRGPLQLYVAGVDRLLRAQALFAGARAAYATGKVKRPVLFTHSDTDGAGCAVLFRAVLGPQAKVHFCSAADINDRVEEHLDAGRKGFLLLADVSVNERVAVKLDSYATSGPGALLLDHHQTAEWLNRYDWALVDSGACGALWTYRALNQDGTLSAFADFARLVDDYDRWLHQDPRSTQLNQLFSLLGPQRFVQRFLANPAVAFDQIERLLLELDGEARESYIRKTIKTTTVHDLEGRRFGIGWADRYGSDVCHAVMTALDLDGVALIDVQDGRVALRSRGDWDIAALAQRLGGGGHRNAAGALPSELPAELDRVRQALLESLRRPLELE